MPLNNALVISVLRSLSLLCCSPLRCLFCLRCSISGHCLDRTGWLGVLLPLDNALVISVLRAVSLLCCSLLRCLFVFGALLPVTASVGLAGSVFFCHLIALLWSLFFKLFLLSSLLCFVCLSLLSVSAHCLGLCLSGWLACGSLPLTRLTFVLRSVSLPPCSLLRCLVCLSSLLCFRPLSCSVFSGSLSSVVIPVFAASLLWCYRLRGLLSRSKVTPL